MSPTVLVELREFFPKRLFSWEKLREMRNNKDEFWAADGGLFQANNAPDQVLYRQMKQVRILHSHCKPLPQTDTVFPVPDFQR